MFGAGAATIVLDDVTPVSNAQKRVVCFVVGPRREITLVRRDDRQMPAIGEFEKLRFDATKALGFPNTTSCDFCVWARATLQDAAMMRETMGTAIRLCTLYLQFQIDDRCPPTAGKLRGVLKRLHKIRF